MRVEFRTSFYQSSPFARSSSSRRYIRCYLSSDKSNQTNEPSSTKPPARTTPYRHLKPHPLTNDQMAEIVPDPPREPGLIGLFQWPEMNDSWYEEKAKEIQNFLKGRDWKTKYTHAEPTSELPRKTYFGLKYKYGYPRPGKDEEDWNEAISVIYGGQSLFLKEDDEVDLDWRIKQKLFDWSQEWLWKLRIRGQTRQETTKRVELSWNINIILIFSFRKSFPNWIYLPSSGDKAYTSHVR